MMMFAEIDENLDRRDLGAAQRATLASRRKVAYEAVHPETRSTKAGGRNRRRVGDNAARFTADTAAKTQTGKNDPARRDTREGPWL
jgi:hypothetical protein